MRAIALLALTLLSLHTRQVLLPPPINQSYLLMTVLQQHVSDSSSVMGDKCDPWESMPSSLESLSSNSTTFLYLRCICYFLLLPFVVWEQICLACLYPFPLLFLHLHPVIETNIYLNISFKHIQMTKCFKICNLHL